MSALPPGREIYSVSRLNQEVRGLIEAHLPLVWVEGEISNLARPASGHVYFTLKDSAAQVRCAMFRAQNRSLAFRPENGAQVLARGRASLYPGRGEFQIVVDYMEEAGAGALRRAFELLKRRLAAEGLFDADRKRPLPEVPRRIGVITSPSGAAIRDILSVVRRRWRGAAVLIYPVPVQGPEAAPAICRALALAGQRAECDLLILARGGGSLEDLQAFNEESVARAIAACSLPVVTGIGHEIDFTIADFVADRRAATPSAAAELVTPDMAAVLARVRALLDRLAHLAGAAVRQRRLMTENLRRRLRHPRRNLEDAAQRLDGLQARLRRAIDQALRTRAARLEGLLARVSAAHPGRRLAAHRDSLLAHRNRLDAVGQRLLVDRRVRLAGLLRALEAVGPTATLARGYSVVRRADDRSLVRDGSRLRPGDLLDIRFARGGAEARVERPREGHGDEDFN